MAVLRRGRRTEQVHGQVIRDPADGYCPRGPSLAGRVGAGVPEGEGLEQRRTGRGTLQLEEGDDERLWFHPWFSHHRPLWRHDCM